MNLTKTAGKPAGGNGKRSHKKFLLPGFKNYNSGGKSILTSSLLIALAYTYNTIIAHCKCSSIYMDSLSVKDDSFNVCRFWEEKKCLIHWCAVQNNLHVLIHMTKISCYCTLIQGVKQY